jgi:hypothetical protein
LRVPGARAPVSSQPAVNSRGGFGSPGFFFGLIPVGRAGALFHAADFFSRAIGPDLDALLPQGREGPEANLLGQGQDFLSSSQAAGEGKELKARGRVPEFLGGEPCPSDGVSDPPGLQELIDPGAAGSLRRLKPESAERGGAVSAVLAPDDFCGLIWPGFCRRAQASSKVGGEPGAPFLAHFPASRFSAGRRHPLFFQTSRSRCATD